MIKKIILFAFVLLGTILHGQDLQFSQFNSMPLALNPAFTGNNQCNYRVSALGRNQWMGLSGVTSYQSGTVAADFNIGANTDYKGSFWGVGLMTTADRSGDNKYYNNSALISLAYHFRFGEDAENLLSFGMQGGVAQRSFLPNNLTFDDQIDYYGRKVRSTSESFVTDNKLYPDFNVGALVTLNPNESFNFYAGASVYHLIQPNISFTESEYKLPARINVHSGAKFTFNDKLIIAPSLLFQYQKNFNYNFGTYFGSIFTRETQNKIPFTGYLGVWYKSTDAICFAARADIGPVIFAFSYDVNTTKISQNTGMVGSPELSITYFGCFGRNSKRSGCPFL
jgi:type IX secretion system PorP/SprF family membrane protein